MRTHVSRDANAALATRCIPPELTGRWSVQPGLFGRTLFRLDELSAPLVPAVALVWAIVDERDRIVEEEATAVAAEAVPAGPP